MWCRAIVQATDPGGMRVQVVGPEDGWTAWCSVTVPWPGVCWLPPVGAQVAVLLDELGESGVVLGSLYSQRDPAPPGQADGRLHVAFPDGSTVEFDSASGLRVAAQGGCEVAAVGPVRVNSSDRVTVSAPELAISATESCRIEASGPVTVLAHGACEVRGAERVTVEAPAVSVTAVASLDLSAPAITLRGTVSIQGPVNVQGIASFSANVSVGGNLAVVGTTPAHHTHPVSGGVAQAVP